MRTFGACTDLVVAEINSAHPESDLDVCFDVVDPRIVSVV